MTIPQLKYQINEDYTDVRTDNIDGVRFYRSPGNKGKRVPSVTSMIGAFYNTDFLKQWQRDNQELSKRILAEGTRFHAFAEDLVLNKNPVVQNPADRALSGLLQKRLQGVYASELGLAGELFGGRLDLLGVFDNLDSLIDFKTTQKPKERWMIEKYFVQGILYTFLLREAKFSVEVKQIVIILVEPDGSISVETCQTNDPIYLKKAIEVVEAFRGK